MDFCPNVKRTVWVKTKSKSKQEELLEIELKFKKVKKLVDEHRAANLSTNMNNCTAYSLTL